jgi:transcriptional regulator with XRE-family HTH domain
MLKEYTQKKGFTIKGLSEQCGIDRTFLHKILKGERKPPNEQFVEEMSRVLMLTDEESAELTAKYNIAVMGEEVYQRRSEVREILHNLARRNAEPDKNIKFRLEIDIDSIPAVTSFNDGDELIKNVQLLVSYDVFGGSDVKIAAEPSQQLNSILRYCVDASAGGTFYHLFSFDNTANEKNSNRYNLAIFPFICSLAIEHENYKPFYCYDNTASQKYILEIMHNMIVTEHFVIFTNDDWTDGIIYKSAQTVDFYSGVFDRIKSKCTPLLETIHDITEIREFIKGYDDCTLIYDYQPCLILGLNDAIYDSHVRISEPTKTVLSEMLQIQKERHLSSNMTVVFSESGLAEFMESGVIYELPDAVYTHPSPEERREMLSRVIGYVESGKCDYRVIKSEWEATTKNFGINMIQNRMLKIISRSDNLNYFEYISVSEQSLVYAFGDYLNYLLTTDSVCSTEESLEIMKKYL